MSKWTKILRIQIFISCILSVYFKYTYPKVFEDPYIEVINKYGSEIICGSLIISYILLLNNNKNKYIDCLSRMINVLFLPYDLVKIYLISFQVLFKTNSNFNSLIGLIRIIGFTQILIPLTIVSFSKIKAIILRLISVEIIIYNYLIFIYYSINKSNILISSIEKSSLVFAVSFIIFIYWLLKAWGLKIRINLKQKWGIKSIVISLLLVIFLIWYDFFASFVQISPNLTEAIWNWNLRVLNPNQSLFFYSNPLMVYLSSINGGIFEEFERYIILIILGLGLTNKKLGIEIIILLSSLIFSIGHYDNILLEQKSFMNATFQVIDVFSFGCLLAIIYLYTGKLWLSIIIHATWDFIVFAMTPDALEIGSFLNAYDADFLIALITNIIALPVIIFMLTGSRKIRIKNNMNKILIKC